MVVFILSLLALAYFSYHAVNRSKDELNQLVTLGLPQFSHIEHLRSHIYYAQTSIYAYYLNGESKRFANKFSRQIVKLKNFLGYLEADIKDKTLTKKMHHTISELEVVGERFHQLMLAKPIDWDKARDILAKFEPLARQMDKLTHLLTLKVQTQLAQVALNSNRELSFAFYMVSTLSLLSILSVVLLLSFNRHRMQAVREQQRLANFPKRNPSPVISLNPQGEVIYANEAALSWAEKYFSSDSVEVLLPENLDKHLNLKVSIDEWEYKKSHHIFQISLCWLADANEFHVYLADITARKSAESRSLYLAYHDPLTALPNRIQFNKIIGETMLNKSFDVRLVALVDIDKFQRILTLAGYSVAERVIENVAKRIATVLSNFKTDSYTNLYRFDGSLFCITFSHNSKVEMASLKSLLSVIKEPMEIEGHEFFLSISIGLMPIEEQDKMLADEILRKADNAMSQAKTAGGDRMYTFEDSLEERNQKRITIENGLRRAKDKGELELYYQPLLSVETGELVSLEALLRWHQQGDIVYPDEFIPIAEDSGLIVHIGEWVIEKACYEILDIKNHISQNIAVAVNISSKQLLHSQLVHTILRILNETNLSPSMLQLEITETTALDHFDHSIEVMKELTDRGISFSLDDFGTGYSSLSYLQRLPVNKLKIDKSFINNMLTDRRDASIIQAVMTLARNYQLTVVAEGVESPEAYSHLVDLGCDEIQGYLLSKPLAKDDVVPFIKQHQSAQWLH